MIFKISNKMINIIPTPIIHNRLYNTSYITIYENSKINVEESSWIPPTCFPASQMLNNIDNITFSSIWYILLNRINIENLTNWLAVQSNNQHTVNQTISNSSKNITWNYKLFKVSEIYSHWRVNRYITVCVIWFSWTIYFAINCNELGLTRGQSHCVAPVHTILSDLVSLNFVHVRPSYDLNK